MFTLAKGEIARTPHGCDSRYESFKGRKRVRFRSFKPRLKLAQQNPRLEERKREGVVRNMGVVSLNTTPNNGRNKGVMHGSTTAGWLFAYNLLLSRSVRWLHWLHWLSSGTAHAINLDKLIRNCGWQHTAEWSTLPRCQCGSRKLP